MPPASNTTSTSSKSKANRFAISTSPDSESTLPEPPQTVAGKKKKKNAANKQTQHDTQHDEVSNTSIAVEDHNVAARPKTILSQIGHGFPISKESSLIDDQDDEVTTSGKVSDQNTPPNDTWLEDEVYGKADTVDQPPEISQNHQPVVEPGFSTRNRYDSRSPPISPPTRYARPLSYGGNIPPMPSLPRGSPSGYTYTASVYGSPPAPHMVQPHFYHAQDMNLVTPRTNMPQLKEEASLVRHVRLPAHFGGSHGILLGYENRLNVVRIMKESVDEIGLLEGLSGAVVGAALLEPGIGFDPFATMRPLVVVIVHGPRQQQGDEGNEAVRSEQTNKGNRLGGPQLTEYATRVEIYSLSTQQHLATLLETPSQPPQISYRGAPPTPPNSIGQLKIQVSGAFFTVSSGVSGEVFVFTHTKQDQPGFGCIGKFWTALQPQVQRRDSSHHQSSDADVSPADMGRANVNGLRAISSLNGRWLAISPAGSSSRTSVGAVLGCTISCGRYSGVETTSAPARPSITCEVDSPDADTLFGKVARVAAQEFVKGAKWLGEQGYQTWQSYWRKEQSPSASSASPAFSPQMQPVTYPQNMFPPTHGEAHQSSKEPDLVAIYDLQALADTVSKKNIDEPKPFATFQPPRGCSYLSFAPHGLTLLTTGRKGDIQYVWDLMQIKNCRTQIATFDDDKVRNQTRVRQIAKFERLSGSTVVDVIWDSLSSSRFAVLTKNKTVHVFDLPLSAFRWPPSRRAKGLRPSSRSTETPQHEAPTPSGFFASAMTIANQAQPMIANWRGRAPSMSGGLAGIGQTGIGLASATGAIGTKAVAAGLSKSLGAASETVSQIRHAGESRLHLKTHREALPGRIFWSIHNSKSALIVLDHDSIKQYQLRRNKSQDKRAVDNVTVFAARKPTTVRLPSLSRLKGDSEAVIEGMAGGIDRATVSGFWKPRSTVVPTQKAAIHPLSYAEIETNAPYQPFHSDRRVRLSVFSATSGLEDDQPRPTSLSIEDQSQSKQTQPNKNNNRWVFGDDIPTTTLNISKIQIPDNADDTGSVIYRETVKITSPSLGDDDMDQIVSTTRRRKVKKTSAQAHGAGSDVEKEDGFFEDDCDVLDFAADRV